MSATVALSASGFSTSRVKVRVGDLVNVTLDRPGRAVVESDVVGRPLPWAVGDASGPTPRLFSGLRVINEPRDIDPARLVEIDGVDCVYNRLDWCDVEPARGTYDWSSLDRVADAAIRAGKFFAVGIRAGVSGTPRWALRDPRYAKVKLDGIEVPLLLPQDPEFRADWSALHADLARHLQADGARNLRCTSVTISGMNFHTLEARLPNREAGQDGAIVADVEVWQRAGLTPEGQRGFFRERFAQHRELFPQQDACFPLIQAGFPAVRDAAGRVVPSTDQLSTVLADGRAELGQRLVVEHLGLQPTSRRLLGGTVTPRSVRSVRVGDGLPNQWVLQATLDGSPTAFQTVNDLRGSEDLALVLGSGLANSRARWIELYPRDIPADRMAGGRPLSGWASDFARGAPAPLMHSFRARAGVSYVADAADPRRVLAVFAE